VADESTDLSIYRPDEIPEGVRIVIAIGDNYARESLFTQLQKGEKNLIFPTVFHRAAEVSERAFVYIGTVLCARSVVITGTRIGKGCIINTAATVDHDCDIGDFVHLAPGVHLCGSVKVGARTLVGVGTSVCPDITIGPDTIIGAGSVVVNDIPSGVKAYGNPCRVIEEIK